MSESTNDQDRIERDLERTRARMDTRLTELQERLTPGQILDDLMNYFRGSEGADFARNLLSSVQSNPMPAALTGIGLTWLMASNPHPTTDAAARPNRPDWTAHDGPDRRYSAVTLGVTRRDDETEEGYKDRLDEARGKAMGLARDAKETAQSYAQRIQDAMASATHSAVQQAHDLRDRAGTAAAQLSGSAQQAGNRLAQGGQAAQEMGGQLIASIANNPILLGTFGLAMGALLGALVPKFPQEEATLGNIADQARDTARNLAQEVMDRGGNVAREVADATRESARAHGLTGDKSIGEVVEDVSSGALSGTARDVARDALKSGEDAMRREGAQINQPRINQPGQTGTNGASPQVATPAGAAGAPPPRAPS